jgi:hypothetical protein
LKKEHGRSGVARRNDFLSGVIYPSDAKLGYCIKNFVCETREKSLLI